MVHILQLPDGRYFRVRDADEGYFIAHSVWALLYLPDASGFTFERRPV